MQYLIALDPNMGFSAAEFVTAWNTSDHAAEAPATLSETPPASFMSPEMTVALIAAAASIPTTVIANLITEYLKQKFLDRAQPEVTVTTGTTPAGQTLVIITHSEK